jgi:hypothetical protein
MKASQSEQKGAGSGQHAEEKDKMGQKSKSMSSDEKSGASKDMKAEGQKDRSGTMNAEGQKDRNGRMNAEGQKDRSGNMNAEGQKDRSGTMNAEGQRDRSSTSTSTTGQAGAGGARISVEQRTRITNIIRQQHVQPLTNVNFEIRTGARVPRDVRFHPLPQEIVTIYPQWRGYEYVLVKEQIVVIDPKTLEIVDVIDV